MKQNVRENTAYPERRLAFDGIGYRSPQKSKTGYYQVSLNPGNDSPMADLYDIHGVVQGWAQKVYSTNAGFFPKFKQVEIMARCVAVLLTNGHQHLKMMHNDKTASLVVKYKDGNKQRQFTVEHYPVRASSLICDMQGKSVSIGATEVDFDEFMNFHINEGKKYVA